MRRSFDVMIFTTCTRLLSPKISTAFPGPLKEQLDREEIFFQPFNNQQENCAVLPRLLLSI